MAGFNAELRILQEVKLGSVGATPTAARTPDIAETRKVGIIGAPGVLMVKHVLGSTVTSNWIAYSNSSDISGYRLLRSTTSSNNLDLLYGMDDTPASPPEYSVLEEFATASGDLVNVLVNSSVTFDVTCRKSGSSADVFIEGYVYHRDAAGTETDIGGGDIFTAIGALSTTMTEYNSTITIAQRWNGTERLVYKLRFRNEGVPV